MGRCRNVTQVIVLLSLCVTATVLLGSYMDSTRHRSSLRISHLRLETTEVWLLDLPHFHYMLEAASCGRLEALLLVTSHAGHVEARSAWRRAYPSSNLALLHVRRVFLLAVPGHNDPDYIQQEALQDEARRFGDVVQGNFQEAYRNLSYKHVMGLRWAAERCSLAHVVVKMDDDVVVDIPRLLQLVQDHRDDVSLMGYVLAGRAAVREPHSKWYVTRQEYQQDVYPPFLSGWMYVTTPTVAAMLVRAAARLPYFWVDDVFVTGLAAREAHVPLHDIKHVFASYVELLRCCLDSDKYECDFVVGPNGGQTDMIVQFERHATRCRRLHCPQRPLHKQLRTTCVVRHTAPPLDQGHALVQPLQLR